MLAFEIHEFVKCFNCLSNSLNYVDDCCMCRKKFYEVKIIEKLHI